MRKVNIFAIYVPESDHSNMVLADIKKGSAIVGEMASSCDPLVEIYYEGNLYGAVNLQRFEDRVLCAAGRMRENYPTAACGMVPDSTLREVGSFNYDTKVLTIIDQPALDAWVRP